MPLPGLRLRTLMIAVAVVALMLTMGLAVGRHCFRHYWTSPPKEPGAYSGAMTPFGPIWSRVK